MKKLIFMLLLVIMVPALCLGSSNTENSGDKQENVYLYSVTPNAICTTSEELYYEVAEFLTQNKDDIELIGKYLLESYPEVFMVGDFVEVVLVEEYENGLCLVSPVSDRIGLTRTENEFWTLKGYLTKKVGW